MLKQTQSYPDDFGHAVLDAYVALGHGEPIPDSEPGLDEPSDYPLGVWELANLGAVLREVSAS